MLNRLASGGLISVLAITLLALGYARVFNANRRVYIGIAAAVGIALIGSQFLAPEHIFRIRIADSFAFMGHVLIWASPILIYAFIIRWVRKQTRDQEGSNGT